jgi:hypothetical protein
MVSSSFGSGAKIDLPIFDDSMFFEGDLSESLVQNFLSYLPVGPDSLFLSAPSGSNIVVPVSVFLE